MTELDDRVIDEFRSRGGRVGGALEGVPLLLLTHRGARTGTIRTTPLGFYDDLGTPVVFASNMGAPSHPQWFHNLVANPDVAVELGEDTFSARARVAEGAEREALWARVVADKPFLVEHQARAGRPIPLVRLEREYVIV